jgi:DNA segregation ATPase FtsK/SpoIIIE-like protein
VKSKRPFYICAVICFLGAVLTLSSLIVAARTLEGGFFLSILSSISDLLTMVFLQASWAFPFFLLLIAIFILITAAHKYFWPAILFTIILFSTAILFIHALFGSDTFWLHKLASASGRTKITGLYILGLFAVELLMFYLWSRIVFRKSGKSQAPEVARRNFSHTQDGNAASVESGEILPEISQKEKKKIDKEVSKRIRKMGQKRARRARLKMQRVQLSEERKQEKLAGKGEEPSSPAYRAAEGEHELGGSPLMDDAIMSIVDEDGQKRTDNNDSADLQAQDLEHGLGNKDLTLSFPTIPDLPNLENFGKKSKPVQQEIAFDDSVDKIDIDISLVEVPKQIETVPSTRIINNHENSAIDVLTDDEIILDSDQIEVIEDAVEVLPPIGTKQKKSPSKVSEDEFVPGIIGLSSHAESIDDGSGNASESGGEKKFFTNIRKGNYMPPSEELLINYPGISKEIDENTRKAGEVLMQTLKEFKIDAELTGVQKGPVVTMYELFPAPGIRVQTITNLADNIALQLAASRVRIVAPIPGKQAVGIEVPNRVRSIVGFKEMLQAVEKFEEYAIPVVLGTDITGEQQIIDLVKTPHLLIAGATGSGKSVCVNSLICSILYRRSPKEVRILMVDPKIVELKLYNDIPHLLTPVITEPKKALKALQYCLFEMERRYSLLDGLNVRDLSSYNKRIDTYKLAREKLPYIVVIIDEFADLMTTAGKELEAYLARLAAMARAVGIHLVLATQRPSTNVITGIIKANIPSRIAFMVTSNTDSRIIIDQPGAEKLLGRGDMLFSSSWDPSPSRIQGAFLTEEEVEKIVEHVKAQGEPDYLDESYFMDDEDDDDGSNGYNDDDVEDDLMQEALKIVAQRGSASASYLQRKLKIGYNRAARIVEEMEDRGIVGPAQGSKPRDVLRMPGLD